MAEMDHAPDEHASSRGGLTSGAAFKAVVALWFAALFGGGCLFLPQVLFDMVFNGHAPFGPQTRVVAAIGAAGIGLLMGLFIASKVRSDDSDDDTVVVPSKPRKRGTRPPLDVRAALGLDRDDDDDDDDVEYDDNPDAFDLDDEFKAPIDDPHFASAWSDSDAYEPVEQDCAPEPAPPVSPPQTHTPDWQDAAPAPAPSAPAPSRYNPFADFVSDDEDVTEDRHAFEAPPAPVIDTPVAAEPAPAPAPFREPTPAAPPAPPPPSAWPQPRNEEPALGELGVAELVERLARALQGQEQGATSAPDHPQDTPHAQPMRSGLHRTESAIAQPALAQSDVDRALRGALDRLTRLDDVA